MFGVCCVNPPLLPEDISTETPTIDEENATVVERNDTETGESRKPVPQLSNWPPPLPTHPPHHTIPPLPTHPPSPGYPTLIPISSNPTLPWQKPKPPKPTTKPPSSIGNPLADASCGAKNGLQDQERIVGGHNADIGEWPWIAALFNGGRQFCGGSLVDNIHILSAAHCVAQ